MDNPEESYLESRLAWKCIIFFQEVQNVKRLVNSNQEELIATCEDIVDRSTNSLILE